MKIALIGTNVIPKSQIENPMQYNIAIYYIASYLKNRFGDLDIDIYDFPIHVEMDRLPKNYIDKIYESKADIYGFSSYCWDRDLILELIKDLKIKYINSKVIIGGPTATFEGYNLMKENKEIDYAVIGEGEEVLARLIKEKLNPQNINGLLYRRGDDIIFNGYTKPINNLDTIPSPFINGLIKPHEMNLMLGFSRGCINKCKHCAWKNLGGGIRYFSIKRIQDELKWAKNNKYRHIFIYDSSINSSNARLQEITKAVKLCKLDSSLSFTYFIDHTKWSRQQGEMLKDINTRCALIGLESISGESSVSLGRRPVDVKSFTDFIGDIVKIAPIIISVMVGIPSERAVDFKRTIDYAVNLVEKYGRERILGIRIFWTIITPGSRLALESTKYGIKYATKGIPYMLSSKIFSRRDLIESFMYLNSHKYKELFIWEDINPEKYFKEIKDFDLLPEYRDKYVINKIDLEKLLTDRKKGDTITNTGSGILLNTMKK